MDLVGVCGRLLLTVWCVGWFGGCTVAFYTGVRQLFFQSKEDTREGKIQQYCNAVDAWTAKERAVMAGFQFTLNSTFNETYSSGTECVSVATPSAPEEQNSMVSKMSDGACSGYVPLYVQCQDIEKLVPAPEFGATYKFDLYNQPQRTSLSRRVPTGNMELSVSTLQDNVLHYQSSGKNCGTECARKMAERKCVEAGGNVHSWNANTLQCSLLYQLKDPCFVLEDITGSDNNVVSWAFDKQMWSFDTFAKLHSTISLPEARCLRPEIGPIRVNYERIYGTPESFSRAGHETMAVRPDLMTSDALRQLTPHVKISLRSQHDPYVLASMLTSSTFEFGFSGGFLRMGGFVLLLVSMAMCACPCCLFGCGFFGDGLKRSANLRSGDEDDDEDEDEDEDEATVEDCE